MLNLRRKRKGFAVGSAVEAGLKRYKSLNNITVINRNFFQRQRCYSPDDRSSQLPTFDYC